MMRKIGTMLLGAIALPLLVVALYWITVGLDIVGAFISDSFALISDSPFIQGMSAIGHGLTITISAALVFFLVWSFFKFLYTVGDVVLILLAMLISAFKKAPAEG